MSGRPRPQNAGPVPDCKKTDIIEVLETYLEKENPRTWFLFGQYSNTAFRNRNKAAHGDSLVLAKELLQPLVRLQPACRIKATLIRQAVQYIQRRHNIKTAPLPPDIWARQTEVQIGVMLTHVRRLKQQPVKLMEAVRQLNAQDADIVKGLVNMCTAEVHKDEDADKYKTEDTDEDMEGNDGPDISAGNTGNTSNNAPAKRAGSTKRTATPKARQTKQRKQSDSGDSISLDSDGFPKCISKRSKTTDSASATSNNIEAQAEQVAQTPLPGYTSLKKIVAKKPAADTKPYNEILGNLRMHVSDDKAYIQNKINNKWCSVVNIAASHVAQSEALSSNSVSLNTFTECLLKHIIENNCNKVEAVAAKIAWIACGLPKLDDTPRADPPPKDLPRPALTRRVQFDETPCFTDSSSSLDGATDLDLD